MTLLDLRPASPPRALADQTSRQIAAIDAFHRAQKAAEWVSRAVGTSREMRMDAARRLEVLRRQHDAIVARADLALRSSGDLIRTARRTALVAHRQPWFTSKVTALLHANGVEVLDHTDVGADAVGWAIVEQPDLVLVEDALSMLSGADVVREIRRYCDTTVIGGLVAYSDRAEAMLDAGAATVHVRAVPPAQVVDDLLALLPG